MKYFLQFQYVKFFFTVLLLSFKVISYSQTIAIPIGSIGANEGASTIVLGPSGDYFMGGYSDNKALVIRTTNSGEIVWSKTLDFGPDPDYILEMMLSSDNYLVGVGMSRTGGGLSDYGFAFKLDLDGAVLWSRKVNEPGNSFWAQGLSETSSGNYQFCGAYKNVNLNNFIFELDNVSGVTLWDSIYVRTSISNAYDETFYDTQLHTSNNAMYLSGRFQKAASNLTYRPSLTKISATGEIEWSKTYLYNDATSGGRFYGMSVVQDDDSLAIGLICRNNASPPPFEAGIIKTDLDGNMSWAKLYASPGKDLRASTMINLADGYLLAGHIESGDKSLFLIKTNHAGVVQWSKYYGGLGDESVWFLNENSRVIVDGGYAVTVGRTNGFGASYDIFLVKVDLATGELVDGSCYGDLTIVTSGLPNFQADYPMVRIRLPLSFTNPAVPITDVVFDNVGQLIDFEADTIVSDDTLYLCDGTTVDVFADWDPGFDFLWNTGSTDQHVYPAISGLYRVEVYGEGGCYLTSDSVWVIMDSLTIDLGADTSICNGSPLVLNAGSHPDAVFEWNDGTTGETITASETGWYSVSITGESCTANDSVFVSIVDLTMSLGNDTSICNGEFVILDALNPGADYLWSDGAITQLNTIASSGIYWVNVDNDGCILSDTISISVSDIYVNLGPDTTLCSGEIILIDAGVIDGDYLWDDGSVSSSRLINSAGVYYITVSDSICSDQDSIEISFENVFSSFEGTPIVGCAPLVVNFTDLSSSTGIINSWSWHFGDGASAIISDPSHTYTSSGVYTVDLTVSSVNGCLDDSIIVNYIEVVDPVSAFFTFSPDYVSSEELIYFSGITTNAIHWLWDFGDGTSSILQNPTHQFEIPGNYTVTLTASNSAGCDDSYAINVNVINPTFVFVPNVFTLDGDVFNNTWQAYMYGIDFYDFHLILFDRWGEIIWESYNADVAWNGTYNGALVQDGVYVWIIEYGDLWTDENKVVKGHVTVLK